MARSAEGVERAPRAAAVLRHRPSCRPVTLRRKARKMRNTRTDPRPYGAKAAAEPGNRLGPFTARSVRPSEPSFYNVNRGHVSCYGPAATVTPSHRPRGSPLTGGDTSLVGKPTAVYM